MNVSHKQMPTISPAAEGLLKFISKFDHPPQWFIIQNLGIPLRVFQRFGVELMNNGLIVVNDAGHSIEYTATPNTKYQVSELFAYTSTLLNTLRSSPSYQWTLEQLKKDKWVSETFGSHVIEVLYELKLAQVIELGSEEDGKLSIFVLNSNAQLFGSLELSQSLPAKSASMIDKDNSRELFRELIHSESLEVIDQIIEGMDVDTQRLVLTRFARTLSNIRL